MYNLFWNMCSNFRDVKICKNGYLGVDDMQNIVPSFLFGFIFFPLSSFNLLRLVLQPIWSILVNVPCVLEQNMYSAIVGQSILYISIKSRWLIYQVSYIFEVMSSDVHTFMSCYFTHGMSLYNAYCFLYPYNFCLIFYLILILLYHL